VGTRALAGDMPSHTTQVMLEAGLRRVATSGGSRLVVGRFRGGKDEYATTQLPRQYPLITFSSHSNEGTGAPRVPSTRSSTK
jgi:hypothetical protein